MTKRQREGESRARCRTDGSGFLRLTIRGTLRIVNKPTQRREIRPSDAQGASRVCNFGRHFGGAAENLDWLDSDPHGLAVLEQIRPHVWVAGGYSGTGNVIGALCGRALVAAALDGDPQPARVLLGDAWTMTVTDGGPRTR